MDIIQIVIQAGAVGIAIYVIYTMKVLIGNHFDHNTKAFNKLTEAVHILILYLKNGK